jgi:hypothetical protein
MDVSEIKSLWLAYILLALLLRLGWLAGGYVAHLILEGALYVYDEIRLRLGRG